MNPAKTTQTHPNFSKTSKTHPKTNENHPNSAKPTQRKCHKLFSRSDKTWGQYQMPWATAGDTLLKKMAPNIYFSRFGGNRIDLPLCYLLLLNYLNTATLIELPGYCISATLIELPDPTLVLATTPKPCNALSYWLLLRMIQCTFSWKF